MASEQLEAAAGKLGRTIGNTIPPGTGFALLIFDFGEVGNMAYISNAQRRDMIAALKELIAKMEAD